jgi:hypothetical protein
LVFLRRRGATRQLLNNKLYIPPVELESEHESSDVFDDTPTFESTPIGNSDPSNALTGPPSVSGGLFLSSVMVVPDESLESSDLFLSLSSKSVTDLIASIFSIILSILESLLLSPPVSDRPAIFLATGAGDYMY